MIVYVLKGGGIYKKRNVMNSSSHPFEYPSLTSVSGLSGWVNSNLILSRRKPFNTEVIRKKTG